MRRLPDGLLTVGCGASVVDDTIRDDGGVIVERGDVGILALNIGDCFDVPVGIDDSEDAAEINSVAAIPCAEPYDNQAFAAIELPDGDWLGEDAVADQAFDGCLDRFESVIGEPYETSPLDILALYPTEQG